MTLKAADVTLSRIKPPSLPHSPWRHCAGSHWDPYRGGSSWTPLPSALDHDSPRPDRTSSRRPASRRKAKPRGAGCRGRRSLSAHSGPECCPPARGQAVSASGRGAGGAGGRGGRGEGAGGGGRGRQVLGAAEPGPVITAPTHGRDAGSSLPDRYACLTEGGRAGGRWDAARGGARTWFPCPGVTLRRPIPGAMRAMTVVKGPTDGKGASQSQSSGRAAPITQTPERAPITHPRSYGSQTHTASGESLGPRSGPGSLTPQLRGPCSWQTAGVWPVVTSLEGATPPQTRAQHFGTCAPLKHAGLRRQSHCRQRHGLRYVGHRTASSGVSGVFRTSNGRLQPPVASES